MRLSRLIGSRYKERPADAVLDSHAFLLRGAYARPVANGIYSLLAPGRRVIARIEAIIREEMGRIGAQEILMPLVLPRELWDESGRYAFVGSELARFDDRTGHGMLLAMAHEEAVIALCRNEVRSHAQLPFLVYQIQTQFRDEPRSRGGLIRVRESIVNDAYSFHAGPADLERAYYQCHEAYRRIFARVGLPEVAAVEADGGRAAHKFLLLADSGEDTAAVCDSCSYKADVAVARGRFAPFNEPPRPLEKVHTPGTKTIAEVAAFLGVEHRQTAKVVFYETDAEGRLVVLLIRGDLDVSEAKVARLIGRAPVAASESRIQEAGAVPGFATPMGLDPSKCRIIVDHTVAESDNLVCGANEMDHHYRHFNLNRDLPGVIPVDIAEVVDGTGCPVCEGSLRLRQGIEVGRIVQLGPQYTEAMHMTFTDEQGRERTPLMGCYGIELGRLMAAVMEARHDPFGPQWPVSVAPWPAHICAIKADAPGVRETAESLYTALREAGIDPLYDDRNTSPGVQFADADLLGAPIRFVVSGRNNEQDVFEYKRRDTGERGTVPRAEAVTRAVDWVREALNYHP